VIATGFGVADSRSMAQTPTDLSSFTEVARLRAEPAVTAPRFAVARRSLPDLPVVIAASVPLQAPQAVELNLQDALAEDGGDSAFDVPAFLRRQEN
jgi:hypothetical protein